MLGKSVYVSCVRKEKLSDDILDKISVSVSVLKLLHLSLRLNVWQKTNIQPTHSMINETPCCFRDTFVYNNGRIWWTKVAFSILMTLMKSVQLLFIQHAGWRRLNCVILEQCTVLPLSVPANCLSPLPRLPNLVTSLPLTWKMKTQQDLLSTTMMWPFLSTDTPLGPISFPEPILFWRDFISRSHAWGNEYLQSQKYK